MKVKTHNKMEYFISFIDDFSRFGYVYLIVHKSQALEKFKEYKKEVETQLGRSIKGLNTDRGGECTSELFKEYYKENGIHHVNTMPYTPEQNGVAERRNQTLMDMSRSMMAYADLSLNFWGEALSTSSYILNRITTKSKKLTPFEYWTGHKPDLSNLTVWVFKAHVLIPKSSRDKLSKRSYKCKFIGYSQNSSGYRFYRKDKGLIESKDATFIEDVKQTTPLEELKLLEEQETLEANVEVPLLIPPDISQENEERAKDKNPRDIEKNIVDSGRKRKREPSSIFKDYYALTTTNVKDNKDPRNFEEAISSSESIHWKNAMDDELDSIKKNKVWELVELPKGRKPIGYKWIFKKKLKSNRTLDKYKARLVAKG